ncbi:MAG: GNAT family N-acetyltransferase [Chloroflexi bacterium]|nr:MAG: GNAT family N-acetyltransferase [Chloroflexota bacterium]TMB92624.1 MAG: GNAT family N-acetyltransferase [Chloroflexota bacterium]TME40931.1 MAG: GNAT family N-acetyltransferase [Chloroflexota bacterium]
MTPLTTRELTPALLDDYLAFFDHDAFADFPWWSACFCRFWNDPGDPQGDSRPERRDRHRALAADLVLRGQTRGILAYADGKVIGWCNAAPRSSFLAPRRIAQTDPDPAEPVGATVCFIVAAPYRGQGIASAMLAAACDSFREQGLRYAEAYPNTTPPSGPYASETPWSAHNHLGPLEMYLGAGFRIHKELERFAVVRKML